METVKSTARATPVSQKKALMGVSHGSRKELIALCRELDRRKPVSVGLELREDYEPADSRIGFFGDIYTYFKLKVVRLVLLDNPDLWNETQAMQFLKAIHEGVSSLARLKYDLAEIMRRLEEDWITPEERIPSIIMAQRLQRALELNQELPTGDLVLRRWQELNVQRSDYFVGRILHYVPELVVVGLDHARQMAPKLAEQYTLEIFSEAPAELKGRTILSHDLLNQ